MKVNLQVLSEEERARVHEATLDVLGTTGVRVDTELGRRALEAAGARDRRTSSWARADPERTSG
jgi:trimethylamine:corrinoid methyltransferase-like protein